MTETKDRIFGLDIIRCIAILFIMVSHTCFILPVSDEAKDFMIGYFGITGVELFFILSGYLVGKILLQLLQKRSPSFSTIKYFWIRRWFRTLPAYYLTILLYVVLYWFVTDQFVFEDTFNLLYLVFLQNFFTAPPTFFRHSWSLSVEEWFYLGLPLWFLFFHRFIRKMSVFKVIVAGIILFTLIRFVAVLLFDPNWNLGVRTRVPLRLDSLMIGVLMAYLHLHYRDTWAENAKRYFIIGLVTFIPLSVWLYLDIVVAPDVAHYLSKTLFFSLFSMSIALLMPYMTSVRTASVPFIGKVVTHISLISYSLYLIHVIVTHLYLKSLYKTPFGGNTYVRYIGAWVGCIVVSTIMFNYFEKPFTNLRERFKLKSASNPKSSGVSSV